MNMIKQIYLINKSSNSKSCFMCILRKFGSEKINIPAYIKRSPTSILEAIAATVNVDSTGPAFKFHDDPFLTPMSNIEKRKYALSKESGRKAAQFIRDSHPDCFTHQPDDPIIKSLIPKLKYEEDMNEDYLISCIQNFQVSEAIKAYQDCQNKNLDLSIEALQALLELVSYCNVEDPINPYWKEELITQNLFKDARLIKSWKDRGIAEEIFEKIKNTGAKPYCAIIRGMCTYFQTDRAWHLYQEALEKNLCLDTDTYNSLFRVSLTKGDEGSDRWEFMKNLLEKMVESNLTPNLGTLNSALECLSLSKSWKKSAAVSLQVVKEFHLLNIEPSLATYCYLIKIHQLHKNSSSSILLSILDVIEGQNFMIKDVKDTWFFFTAMEACKSWEVAERIHKILHTGNNYKLLGGTMSENIYYRNLLIQAAQGLPLQNFMKVYEKFVPFAFSPDSEVMEEILKMFGIYDSLDALPQIWSDIITLGHSNNETLIELTLMVMNKYPLEGIDSSLGSSLVNIAWDIWERIHNIKDDPKMRTKVEWTGPMLGDCISTLIRCNASDKGFHIIRKVHDNPSILLGHIPVVTLQIALSDLIGQKKWDHCLVIVTYAKECEYPEAVEMAKLLAKEEGLAVEVKNKLIYSFGQDII